MSNRTPGSTWVRVPGRYAKLLSGELSVDDLDDEELSRGQLRSADGKFNGYAPRVVPQVMLQAMRREWMERANSRLRQALMEKGIGTLVRLAGDENVDPSVRLRAAQTIMDRTMGKVPDKVELTAEDPIEALFRGILNDPNGLAPAPREFSAEERMMLS
jgi:hypothetical protein